MFLSVLIMCCALVSLLSQTIGKPTHFVFDMNMIRDKKLVYPAWPIHVYGDPQQVQGVIGKAISLDGHDQYIDIGNHTDNCLGNLQLCRHGYTGSMYMNFPRFRENDYYLSTGGDGINMFYKNGKVHVTFEQSGKRWDVSLPQLKTDKWYHIEYTWNPDKGLQAFLDNEPAGTSKGRDVSVKAQAPGNKMLLGRVNPSADPNRRGQPGNVNIDQLEVWFANRDDLIAFGHLLTPGRYLIGQTCHHDNSMIITTNQCQALCMPLTSDLTTRSGFVISLPTPALLYPFN